MLVLAVFLSCGLQVAFSATVKYNLVYNRAIRSLDGFNKSVILVNGKFPGPPLRARIGDTVSVIVTNFLMEMEMLSVHWHGIDQRGTPWFELYLINMIHKSIPLMFPMYKGVMVPPQLQIALFHMAKINRILSKFQSLVRFGTTFTLTVEEAMVDTEC